MNRKMCFHCPFNPESSTFHLRDEWLKKLEDIKFEFQTDLPQGCHTLENGQINCEKIPFQENPELQCVGHIAYMKERQNAS